MTLRFAVDIGGTFTDVTAFDSETARIVRGKSLSTPSDLVGGVLDAISACEADVASASSLIHGSTVVINALLERRGAETALVTTAGFRDVYEIGRINRPQSFNLFFRKHQPLVLRDRIYEIHERLLADGSVHREFPAAEATELARRLGADEELESVAVVLLHAYRNPEHERAMREILEREAPDLFVTTSHELTREYREYERTATVVANAYVGPRVSRYLSTLEERLRREGFTRDVMIMQSTGGVSDVATARRQCVQMVESGPAGGVTGTIALCELLGISRAIAFDMGGTTAKACVVQDRAARLAAEYFVGGYDEGHPIRVPVLDIHEVGTGGGSIAYVEAGGGLRVGPQSAGADPGPVAYARGGTEPTVTDAQVALGRLGTEAFHSGGIELNPERAVAAIAANIAEPLGLETAVAALGIVAVANAAMANAVRAVTLERGFDPRDFALVAYGGAGPLHAVEVARDLSIPTVIIPFAPGHFSALGMLMADYRRDFVQTYFTPLRDGGLGNVEAVYRELEAEGTAQLEAAGIAPVRIVLERSADMRYRGQEHAVSVPVPASLETADATALDAAFHARHQQEYRHHAVGEAVEIVSVRVSAIGRLDKPHWIEPSPNGGAQPLERRRPVWFSSDAGPVDTPIAVRGDLRPGERRAGPLVVEEEGSVTIVPASAELTVDRHGNLVITC
jgi:N-methylhydantoinase A